MLPHCQDPGVLARLGAVYSKDDDETQAYHYHLESYRFYPVDMDVLSWLGAYHVKNEMYEKAIEYFHMASQIQPHEVLPNQTSREPRQSAAQPWADGLTDCATCNMPNSVASEHKKDSRSVRSVSAFAQRSALWLRRRLSGS